MKRLRRLPLRIVMRLTRPIRSRLLARTEAWLDRYIAFAAEATVEEANLALDFAAADLARIRAQVEGLSARASHARAFANAGADPYNPRLAGGRPARPSSGREPLPD